MTNKMLEQVKEFNANLDSPGWLSSSKELDKLLVKMIEEEVKELRDAVEANHIEEVVDALCDILYTTLGAVVRWDIGIEEAFNRVHTSNMSKLVDGYFLKNEDGKVIKPDSYQPPNFEGVIVDGHSLFE